MIVWGGYFNVRKAKAAFIKLACAWNLMIK